MAAIWALCRVTLAPWARCQFLTHRLIRKCPVLYSPRRRLPPLLCPWVVCSTAGPCSRWWPRSEAAGEPRWHRAHGPSTGALQDPGGVPSVTQPGAHKLQVQWTKSHLPGVQHSTSSRGQWNCRRPSGRGCLCHKARSPPAWEQLGRHREGEPRSRHSHLFHCRHKTSTKLAPGNQPHTAEAAVPSVCPSPPGKRIFLLLWSPHRFHVLIPLVDLTHASW